MPDTDTEEPRSHKMCELEPAGASYRSKIKEFQMATFNERDEQIITVSNAVTIRDFDLSSAYSDGIKMTFQYGFYGDTQSVTPTPIQDDDPFYNVFQCPICVLVREGDDCQVCGYIDPTPLWQADNNGSTLKSQGWTRFECDSCGDQHTSTHPYFYWLSSGAQVFCRCNWSAYRLVGPVRPS